MIDSITSVSCGRFHGANVEQFFLFGCEESAKTFDVPKIFFYFRFQDNISYNNKFSRHLIIHHQLGIWMSFFEISCVKSHYSFLVQVFWNQNFLNFMDNLTKSYPGASLRVDTQFYIRSCPRLPMGWYETIHLGVCRPTSVVISCRSRSARPSVPGTVSSTRTPGAPSCPVPSAASTASNSSRTQPGNQELLNYCNFVDNCDSLHSHLLVFVLFWLLDNDSKSLIKLLKTGTQPIP